MKYSLIPRGKSGRYSMVYYDETGKQRWLALGTSDRKEAEKLARELAERAEQGAVVLESNATLKDYLTEWLRVYAKPNVAQTTYDSYEMVCRVHIIPALGGLKLSELKPLHVQRYMTDKLNSDLSATTVRYHYRILSLALDMAVDWEYINRNPAKKAKPPRKADFEAKVWTTGECIQFLKVLRNDPMFAFYATVILTGMRRGEVVGMRWSDIDFEEGVYKVRETVVVTKGGLVRKPPKSRRGRRAIKLGPILLDILREQRERVAAMKAKAKRWEECGLVFPNRFGRPLDPHNISGRHFPDMCEKAKVPRIRLHDLRHTHLTELLRAGTHLKIASERAGHSSETFTASVYQHPDADMQLEAAVAVESRIMGGVLG